MGKATKKQYTLYAFDVKSDGESVSHSGILEALKNKLDGSRCIDRVMILNKEDPSNEKDFIASYSSGSNDMLRCVMLRMAEDSLSGVIPEDLLEKDKLAIEQLQSNENNGRVYKNHYYFVLSDKHLITTNRNFKSLETYVNYYLRKDIDSVRYYFNATLSNNRSVKIKDIKRIEIYDPLSKEMELWGSENTTQSVEGSIQERVLELFAHTEKVDSFKGIISAKLLIEFKIPKGYPDTEKDKIMSQIITDVGDNVAIVTKRNGTITGSEMVVREKVDIEKTATGFISEEQLYQEMEALLLRLKP